MDQPNGQRLGLSWPHSNEDRLCTTVISDRAALEHAGPLILESFDYWQGLCARLGRLPSHKDIQPTRIPRLLSRFVLVDLFPNGVLDPMFRLAGTKFELVAGRSLSGVGFREVYDDRTCEVAVALFEEIMRDGKPRYLDACMRIPDREFHRMQRTFLPFSEDGARVDHIGGVAVEVGDL